jgi:chitinase
MLGVNDVTSQRFTTKDARGLAKFVDARGIPRVSAWSLNRDSQCGGAFAKTGELSNTCSGVLQKPLEFTHIFSKLRGTKTAAKETAVASGTAIQTESHHVTDDPKTSPWQPIGPVPPGSTAPPLVNTVEGSFAKWSPTTVYHEGDRVEFDGRPYQARWYTQGEQPLDRLPSDPSAPWEPLFKYPGEPNAGAETE